LGLAVGLEDEPVIDRVVVTEGDGSLLMGFSVLTSVGLLRPKKLIVVVLDNGVYLATGGQRTPAGPTDFVAAPPPRGLRGEARAGCAGRAPAPGACEAWSSRTRWRWNPRCRRQGQRTARGCCACGWAWKHRPRRSSTRTP